MVQSEVQANATAASNGSSTGKVKQTRRRQRLNCVECTRRRQKCDRQIPCTSCVSRGIPQLCRWEPIVARPTPQRPPEDAPVTAQHQSTIAALTARIAMLEEAILKQGLQSAHGGIIEIGRQSNSPVDFSTRSSDEAPFEDSTPTPETDSNDGHPALSSAAKPAFSRVDFEVQLAAAKMAQLTVAPPNEYVGGGSILCAIHKLGDVENYRFPYARSGPTTLSNPLANYNTLAAPIANLVSSLPPQETVDFLVERYLEERNWEFGIPERWFKTACQQMWHHLDTHCPGACQAAGSCLRCARELNPHWLVLLFSVLALAPHEASGVNSKKFFMKSLEARRLVEDIMLFSPEYSFAPTQCVVHGVSLSCIAASLLASWLSDRGRISDAWKLVGTAIRQAQAVGLHRDPTWHKWEKMDAEECELRVLAWWYLIIFDRLYSLILGRPTMASAHTFDVKLVPGALHSDGTPNPYVHYQQSFISLIQVAEEVINKCAGLAPASYATVLEMDQKYKLWHSKLHPSLDWRQSHYMSKDPTAYERSIAFQRHMTAAFYLGGLMNLHRPYLMQAPPILPPPRPVPGSSSVVLNPSRERCIESAIELVRVLCDAREEAAQWGTEPQIPFLRFHYSYFVFDGAVALVGALSQDPPHPKAEECLDLMYRAMRMLADIKEAHRGATDGEGDMASRALTILMALRKAGAWDEKYWRQERGAPPACDTAADAAPCANAAMSDASALEQPSGSYASGGLSNAGTGFRPFDPQASSETSGSTSTLFLGADQQAQCVSSFPRPVNVQTATCVPGDSRDLEVDMFLTVPSMDFGGTSSRGYGNAPNMVMPFDMLLNSENDIDWAAVITDTTTSVGGNFFTVG
ncbi:hypothetical protein BD311DRAFT_717184 [Dichomitus squalens]|uniref:Zn(2)-C6 fungal-type domain-containing protein n=1 Tax=Dichomitus squalens TaxID=114155 RepID=A0A4Q9MVN0_9APHY|nr:hypothetical protein BD311DRAFT_717184 [Dichomitus squalens]